MQTAVDLIFFPGNRSVSEKNERVLELRFPVISLNDLDM